MNIRLMSCNYFTEFTIFSEKNKRNYKRIFLTKVFAELFPKSDRVPRRHTNNPELIKSRKFSYLTAHYTGIFIVEPTKNDPTNKKGTKPWTQTRH